MVIVPAKVGIIAGMGRFPVLIAEKIKKISPDTEIFAVGFKGESECKIKIFASDFLITEPGMLGSIINYFKNKNVNNVIMAGLVSHKRIFDKKVKLDPVTKEMFSNLQDQRADSILGGVAKILSAENIEPLSILEFLNEHIAVKGLMTSTPITDEEKIDIDFGFNIAKEISRLDTGQSVVVKRKCVVAIESIEGTDMCILRGGALAGPGSVIIKVAKFHQDLRFDLPVIGTKTMKIMKKVKSKTIAVEAGKTCLIDKEIVIKTADRYNISIVGM